MAYSGTDHKVEHFGLRGARLLRSCRLFFGLTTVLAGAGLNKFAERSVDELRQHRSPAVLLLREWQHRSWLAVRRNQLRRWYEVNVELGNFAGDRHLRLLTVDYDRLFAGGQKRWPLLSRMPL